MDIKVRGTVRCGMVMRDAVDRQTDEFIVLPARCVYSIITNGKVNRFDHHQLTTVFTVRVVHINIRVFRCAVHLHDIVIFFQA